MIELILEFIYNFLSKHVMTSDNPFLNVYYLLNYLMLAALVMNLLIYVGLAAFLQTFMKLKKMRASGLAFVPVYQYYLLGKLAVNKTVGWIMLGVSFMIKVLTWIVKQDNWWWRYEEAQNSLERFVATPLTACYWLALVVLFIVALVKYIRLRGQILQARRTAGVKHLAASQ